MESISGISGSFAGMGLSLDVSTGDQRRGGFPRGVSAVRNQTDKDTDATGLRLTDAEERQVRELKARDREVRAHEQAHIAASQGLARGGPVYSYQQGPDGRMYAIGGEVKLDTSKESDPAANLEKARKMRAAANAPAEPSSQDRAVAAQATQLEAEARRELAEEERSSIGGPVTLSGPTGLSGPTAVSGPAASVSGPPYPLNRRVDVYGNPDPWSPQAGSEAAAAANWEQQYSMNAAATQAVDAAYYDMQALLKTDLEAAWAQSQLWYEVGRLQADAAYEAYSAASHAALYDSSQLQQVDISRAASPASALSAGLYPLDRPTDAIYSASPALVQNSSGISDTAFSLAADHNSSASSQTFAAAVQPSASSLLRASQTYQQNMGLAATNLTPFGTGISLTI